jgi:2-polyprenyl-3-methyl-5-hydroxy-6-metoxy-1,4-benzoquinol methylase
MRLSVPADHLGAFEREVMALQPWMHPYRFGDRTYTGHFKLHGIRETCCVSGSSPDLIARMAAAYADHERGQPDALADRVLADLAPGSTVLDIACATGRHSFALASRGLDVTGVEIRPHQVDQTRLIQRAAPDAAAWPMRFEHEAASADDPDFRKGETYDAVLSLGLLYHLGNPLQHLATLHRLTRRVAVVHTLTHPNPLAAGYWALTPERRDGVTKAVQGVSWTPYFGAVPALLRSVGFARVEPWSHPLVRPYQASLLRTPRRTLVVRHLLRRLMPSPAVIERLGRLGHSPAYFTYFAYRA